MECYFRSYNPFRRDVRDICVFCWAPIREDPWLSIEDPLLRKRLHFCTTSCMKGWRREKEKIVDPHIADKSVIFTVRF